MTSPSEALSAETLDLIKKAQTSGINVGSNITGYDLGSLVSLIPVNTPFFDRVARVTAPGAKNAQWKALTDVSKSQPNPFTGLEAGGGKVQFNEIEIYAPFQPLRMAGQITKDAQDLSRDYADVKAISVGGTLGQWRIGAEKGFLSGQAYPLPAVGTVTLTEVNSGGQLPATTAVFVKVAARSSYNYHFGGSGIASAEATLTTGGAAGHSVVATVPAIRGAVAWDWYVGSATGTEKYLTTTTVNTLTITSIPGANQPVPALPDLSGIAPTAVPVTDTSYSSAAFNGLFAGLAADYGTNALVTPGTGTSNNATFQSLDGAKLTTSGQGVTEIDNLFLSIYNTAQLSPSALIMNGQQAKDIASRITAAGAASTYLQPETNGRVGITGGTSVARYINSVAGGESVDIVVDPHMPVGSIVAVTEKIDYPNSGITNVFESRLQRDVQQWDYGFAWSQGAGGGPAEVWDVSSIETFINRAPLACGVINNIAAG